MRSPRWKEPLRAALFAPACILLLSACASTPGPVTTVPEGDYRERIQTQETNDVRVSAGVPSAKETADIFGKPLYKRGIQPVWLKIENNRDEAITFLPVGLDPQYFSPLEVANVDATQSDQPESLVDEFFID